MSDSAKYKVEGMDCGGCVNSVTLALERALPKAKIHVQLEGGEVSIEGEHEPAQVREAIEHAGFEYAGNA
jgi:copper chaperone